MKTAEQSEARRQQTEVIVAQHLDQLFQRLPMLSGFLVRHDLEVTEIAVFSWPGYTPGKELYDEVMESLVELAEDRPDAIHLLRGRTFARAIQ